MVFDLGDIKESEKEGEKILIKMVNGIFWFLNIILYIVVLLVSIFFVFCIIFLFDLSKGFVDVNNCWWIF